MRYYGTFCECPPYPSREEKKGWLVGSASRKVEESIEITGRSEKQEQNQN
jgi:Zn-finger protein